MSEIANNIAENMVSVINSVTQNYLEKNGNYDQTIVGTIVEILTQDDVYQVYSYRVQTQDKATIFIAYSENKLYKVNDQVWITIPQGNWNNQKLIKSIYISQEDMNLEYEKQKRAFIPLEIISIPTVLLLPIERKDDYKEFVVNFSVDDNIIFNKIYIECLLGTSNLEEAVSGVYGFQVDLLEQGSSFSLYSVNFTSKNVFGNPYYLGDGKRIDAFYTLSNEIILKGNYQIRFTLKQLSNFIFSNSQLKFSYVHCSDIKISLGQ